jgi:protein TonB
MFVIPAEKTRRWWSIPLAMLGEFLVVAIFLSRMAPAAHDLVLHAMVNKLVWVAPPPPPPAPAPAAIRREPVKIPPRKFDLARLKSPVTVRAIPNETTPNEALPEIPEAPEVAGIFGGVPGGVPGGIPGGVLGAFSASLPSVPPPPPPIAAAPSKPTQPSRISVGGRVQSGLLVHEVSPSYPPLAKAARVAGTVWMKAVVGSDGKVKDLALISGPPLLVSAAEAAVRQWVYRPTLLNGLPVEVETDITVNFAFI